MGAGLEGPANAPVLRWQDGVAIVRRIGAWDGEGMLDLSVPDGAAPRSPSASASGSWDGLATHQLGTGAGRRSNDIVGSVLFCLERLIRTRSDHARAALYDLFIDDPIVGYADVLLERLVRQRRIAPDAARPWARWLVEVSMAWCDEAEGVCVPVEARWIAMVEAAGDVRAVTLPGGVE